MTTPEAYEHEGISVHWSCRYGPNASRGLLGCPHEDCIAWERAEMVRLRAENERQSATMRRLRSENQWLRNRRNRAVELLTGDPGDDPLFISADLSQQEERAQLIDWLRDDHGVHQDCKVCRWLVDQAAAQPLAAGKQEGPDDA